MDKASKILIGLVGVSLVLNILALKEIKRVEKLASRRHIVLCSYLSDQFDNQQSNAATIEESQFILGGASLKNTLIDASDEKLAKLYVECFKGITASLEEDSGNQY